MSFLRSSIMTERFEYERAQIEAAFTQTRPKYKVENVMVSETRSSMCSCVKVNTYSLCVGVGFEAYFRYIPMLSLTLNALR